MNPNLNEVRVGAALTTELVIGDTTYKVRRLATIRDRVALGIAIAAAYGDVPESQVDNLTKTYIKACVTLNMVVVSPDSFDAWAFDMNDEDVAALWKEYQAWEASFRKPKPVGGGADSSSGGEGGK